MSALTPEELREYAKALMLNAARNVEYMSIFDMAEEHTGREISTEDADRVKDLMLLADVTVSFPTEVSQ